MLPLDERCLQNVDRALHPDPGLRGWPPSGMGGEASREAEWQPLPSLPWAPRYQPWTYQGSKFVLATLRHSTWCQKEYILDSLHYNECQGESYTRGVAAAAGSALGGQVPAGVEAIRRVLDIIRNTTHISAHHYKHN